MDETQRLSALIAHVYDAALDSALWPHVLEASAGFVGGCASALYMKDAIRKTHNTIHAWGYDPEYTRSYVDKYGRFDPFATTEFFFEIGEPISGADIMSHREHRKSLFYKEWVQPQHWIDAIAATLERSATTYGAFSVIRHERDGLVDNNARRRMKLIVPHVRRAVFIGKTSTSTKWKRPNSPTRSTAWRPPYSSPTPTDASRTLTRQVTQCSPMAR